MAHKLRIDVFTVRNVNRPRRLRRQEARWEAYLGNAKSLALLFQTGQWPLRSICLHAWAMMRGGWVVENWRM